MNVHATLSAEARQDKVWITFKIENRGERRIWLPRAIAADAVPGGPVFDVTQWPDGAAIAYIGARRAAAPASAADYLELAPHSAHTHTIDITPAYAFAAGSHDYQLRYAGAALADIHRLDAATPLDTEPVRFHHSA
jgi:hypothetical protein